MTRTLTLAAAAAAMIGFAGSALAEGGCGGLHAKQSTLETAQTDKSTTAQTPKPADSDS